MKKIVVVYWSGTGNTKAMGEAVANGAKNEDTIVTLLNVADASINDIINADAVAIGCPAMGIEVLEEVEMEPFVTAIEDVVVGKPMALFGSCGWSKGKWLQDFVTRMRSCGAKVVGEGLISMKMPDAQGIKECKSLGNKLSKA